MASGWFTARQGDPDRGATSSPRRKWLSTISYRSQAVQPFTEGELDRLEVTSRARNRAESLTGVLIYDKGRFFQWLEGPVEGLRRVWRSIRLDGRHTQIELLGDAPTPVRFFGGWELKLARRRAAGDGAPRVAAEGVRADSGQVPYRPGEGLQTVRGPAAANDSVSGPPSALRPALAALIEEAVIPRLAAAHSSARARLLPTDPRLAELARLLFAKETSAAFELIDRLKADVGSIESLCAELFEPAARSMGDLWRSDDCSEFDVTLGLARLQVALHRCSAHDAAPVRPGSAGRAVLLSPSPHEPHLLGSAVAVELFWRAGWDVSCDFPRSADALSQLLHERWFDVLDLSLSSAFTREHRLEEMAATIRAARESSINPSLAVIVDGRLFHEHPQAGAAVGADACCSCALELLPAAERQLTRATLH
jgi:hypothetical protein